MGNLKTGEASRRSRRKMDCGVTRGKLEISTGRSPRATKDGVYPYPWETENWRRLPPSLIKNGVCGHPWETRKQETATSR